ncbi:chromosome partitioning protein (plasmid) [Roseobacter denitrificans]|uniref:Chromosome partitioning protein, putative n=1 Tax=Roseobacter denitrificans (strain ATCC 33942 / OCh 114) TaxID=375451 RepID=Q07GE4_ROSDO|nr:ParB N-terminal domain-containing protein [Roseobacter denitrificans]ABI93455.1 chromosome partitioning protein, putative [Roseobacter denitrificans OCh 114]AVL55124.1 chromosome partitioning protein [Roseobacter denitrificans]SFG44593.1 ParB/RepB/Spo0J family partition protein [Roseobacter denitrificans OCh 114]
MAKRKRLSPATLTEAPLETKAALGWVGHGTRRPPIADVTGDAAEQSAFEEVAGELRRARTEGRMVLSLPLEAIDAAHMIRDRVVLDAEEMAVLKDSLRARGQQTPIEVLDLGQGRYGLISGWRRLTAVQALLQETGEDRFKTINALLRAPQDVGASYLAMVEENEIRADLSFYERARIAVQAARAGVFSDTHTAVQSLFSAARAPKRSKIMAFTHLVEKLDADLRFPAAIPEKVGLALVSALQADKRFGIHLTKALRAANPQDATAERKVLDAALKARTATPPEPGEQILPGVTLEEGRGRITLKGANVTPALLADLRLWLTQRER